MDSSPKKLLDRHRKLVHSESCKVTSHVQREEGEWLINTIMIEGYDVPFRYMRKQRLRSLVGQRVNLTYYPDSLQVGGFTLEVMKVVRIRQS
jgi:hypothetical protein